MGGLSSFCRSLFGELIPPGFEAAFYALYAITDKGSSVFGPAIVGAITDATGEIRPVSHSLHSLRTTLAVCSRVVGILVPGCTYWLTFSNNVFC
jgi:MFS-type transporter involved in bile tolerance (Atg22 family)